MRTFNDAWMAAQPKAVQDVLKLGFDARGGPSLDLAMSGVLIDLPIVVYGWQPYYVHLERTQMGIPYIGSLRGLGADPAGISSTGQSPFWVPQPWDYSQTPKGCLPTVFIDEDDDAGNLRRLDALYPPPAPPVVAPPVTVNPLGFFFGPSVLRDYTAPDGTAYKGCPVYAANGPGANGDKYTSPNGKQYILGVTASLMGDTRLWYQIG